MRWKRLPRPLSTSRPVDFVASARSSMLIVGPIKVAISPILAALASGRSVTSIGNRSKEGRSITGQRYPPSTAYSLFLEYHDRGMPSADPMDANEVAD